MVSQNQTQERWEEMMWEELLILARELDLQNEFEEMFRI
jgi:hypothetical protein